MRGVFSFRCSTVVFLLIISCFLIGTSRGSFALGMTADSLRAGTDTPRYDVIVVGGDAEGIAAAVGAARAQAKTLLIDTRPELGGLLTRGWLNTIDLNLDRHGEPLNGGLFGEIFRQLDDHSFDVPEMATLLEKLVVAEPSLDVLKGVLTVLPVIGSSSVPLFRPGQTLHPDDRNLPVRLLATTTPMVHGYADAATLAGVEIHTGDGKPVFVSGRRIIDATQDADLAVAAGAGWMPYGKDVWGTPRNMATTLVFRMSGISDSDWEAMSGELHRQSAGGLLGGTRRSIWGFGEVLQKYGPATDRIKMRALNLGRQKDGSVLANALLVFGIDGLDRESRKEARTLAEKELPLLIDFLNKNIPGLAGARLAGTAPELYVRTSRQIHAQYILTVDDVLENRDFPDRICFGSYPLDVQAQGPDQPGDVTGKPEQYAVPLRCLIPVGFSNLLVVGRSAGFDSLAQSSARTVPVGMAAGQAAGVTAMVSIRTSLPFDRLASDSAALAEVHRILTEQSVNISPNTSCPPRETGHWAYPGLQYLRRKGHLSGGYENAYHLDDPMTGKAFVNRLVNLRTDLQKPDRQKLYALIAGDETLTLEKACEILAQAEVPSPSVSKVGDISTTRDQARNAFEIYQQRGLFVPPWPPEQIVAQVSLTRGAGFLLLSRWLHHQ